MLAFSLLFDKLLTSGKTRGWKEAAQSDKHNAGRGNVPSVSLGQDCYYFARKEAESAQSAEPRDRGRGSRSRRSSLPGLEAEGQGRVLGVCWGGGHSLPGSQQALTKSSWGRRGEGALWGSLAEGHRFHQGAPPSRRSRPRLPPNTASLWVRAPHAAGRFVRVPHPVGLHRA